MQPDIPGQTAGPDGSGFHVAVQSEDAKPGWAFGHLMPESQLLEVGQRGECIAAGFCGEQLPDKTAVTFGGAASLAASNARTAGVRPGIAV